MAPGPRLPALIGVIHLPALPGAPGAAHLHPAEALESAGLAAVAEARLLERLGFEGLVIENFGDVPFYKDHVPPETIASLAVIAAAVKQAVRIPIGINVLRNDARAGLAIASCVDCAFFRVNVLSGLVAADQGLLEGCAAELLRERDRLGARPAILADVHVKHAVTLSSNDLRAAIEDTARRSMADAVVVSGAGTGKPAARAAVEAASAAARACGIPLYLGSGATAENIADTCALVDGIIVSSDLRRGGRAGQPLDAARARRLARAFFSAATSAAGRSAAGRGRARRPSKPGAGAAPRAGGSNGGRRGGAKAGKQKRRAARGRR